MFTPSQSHSGGVTVKPYTGNIAQELQFLTRGKNKKKKRKKTDPILRLGCPWQPSKNISSHIYTNHSVRATAINLWVISLLTNREIMAISGHRNESNVQSYHSIPSVKQLRSCSEVLCTALGHDDKVDEQPANLMISRTPLQQLPFSSVNTAISATHQNKAPFSQMFTSCTIANVQIYTHQP